MQKACIVGIVSGLLLLGAAEMYHQKIKKELKNIRNDYVNSMTLKYGISK